MKNNLINLCRKLYELDRKMRHLEESNGSLEAKIEANEETIVFAMMACTELYEMLLFRGNENILRTSEETVKMTSAMIKIYTNLIKRGLKTLDDIPENLREEVEAAL